MRVTPGIESAGYGLSGDIGGLPKKTYYTPDGRTIKMVPAIREFVKKDKDGKVIETGTRDANLDKWLETPPQVKQLQCQWCSRWHRTQVEINRCRQQYEKLVAVSLNKAKLEEQEKTVSLEKEVAELKMKLDRMMKLMEAQHGAILQPETNEPIILPNGGAKH